MDLVRRCERTITQNTESEAARGWRAAIAAAESGDAAAAAQALRALGEKPRFVATLVLGLAHPAVLVATAVAFDTTVAEGAAAVDWLTCCQRLLVQRWAIAARELSPRVLARILNRAYYGIAGDALLAVIRDRIRCGDLEIARELFATIPEMAKQERGAACAAIGMAMQSDEWRRDAVAAAQQPPVIQSGGEETEALAAVLGEFGGLPATHAAVVACVSSLAKWGKDYVEKDARSYGVAAAVQACVRAGWLDHARALAEIVWSGQLRAQCDQAIASGCAEPPRAYELGAEPTLEEITKESWADGRLEAASTRALYRLDANDRVGAFAAVLAGFDAGDAPAATTEERVAWARALAEGGKRDDARALLMSLVPEGLPREGLELAVELYGSDARPFVETALVNKLELVKYSANYQDTYAATWLARLVARTNDVALERALIEAVAATRQYEDRQGSYPWQERQQRISETLRELAGAYPELGAATPTTERIDAWLEALGPANRVHIAAAAAALAARSLDEIRALAGGELLESHLPALAAELAKRGRLPDALAVTAPCEPRIQQRALVGIAPAVTTPADRKKLVAAFKKCKKTGRDRDAQGMWKFNLGTIMLACDDFDGALEVLAGMDDVRVSNYQPGDLASAIATRLDEAPERWTAARAEALMNVLGGPAVIPQDVAHPLLVVVPSAIKHHRDVVTSGLARIRAKFRQPADAALVDAVEAAGSANAELMSRALGAASRGGAMYADARHFVACVAKLPRGEARDELWQRAFALARTQRPADAKHVVTGIFGRLGPADAEVAARAIETANLPQEVADHARDQLGELVASQLDDAALLPLEAASDPPTVRRRVRQAARFLARRGQHADAARLAKLAGLL